MKKKPLSKAKNSIKKNKNKIIKKRHKCTAVQIANRVEIIKKMRLAEYGLYDILKNSIVKKWKVSEPTVVTYISQADKQIKEYKRSDMPKWIKECEQRLKQLFLVNFQIGEYAECRRVLDTANKILGFEKLKLEVEKTETKTININIKQEIEDSSRIEEVIEEAFKSRLIPVELLEKIGANN